MEIKEYIEGRHFTDIFSCASCGADGIEFRGDLYVVSTPRVDVGRECPLCQSVFTGVYEDVEPRNVTQYEKD